MMSRIWAMLCGGVVVAGLLGFAIVTHAQQRSGSKKNSRPDPEAPLDAKYRVAVATAREQAKLMHEIYESTLHSMHRHYFRRERATLPARALEDVFDDMANTSKVDARWISVNTKPMSIDHEPETNFEKDAAAAIAGGKDHLESIEKGYYQRATPIALGSGCVSCHSSGMAPNPKISRFAGLVIRIPIAE